MTNPVCEYVRVHIKDGVQIQDTHGAYDKDRNNITCVQSGDYDLYVRYSTNSAFTGCLDYKVNGAYPKHLRGYIVNMNGSSRMTCVYPMNAEIKGLKAGDIVSFADSPELFTSEISFVRRPNNLQSSSAVSFNVPNLSTSNGEFKVKSTFTITRPGTYMIGDQEITLLSGAMSINTEKKLNNIKEGEPISVFVPIRQVD